MEFPDVVQRVEKSAAFKIYRKAHPPAFLAHIFVMLDKANEGQYQVGYYDPKKERMTTFLVAEKISALPESEIFKEPESEVLELNVKEVRLSGQDALDLAQECKEEYADLPVLKTFYIVQNLPLGQVFNITYVTQDFHTINIKLSRMRKNNSYLFSTFSKRCQ